MLFNLKHPENIELPKVNTIYKHYKGLFVVVKYLAFSSLEDKKINSLVIYHYLDNPEFLFVRDLSDWNDIVTLEDGTKTKRFSEKKIFNTK